MTKEEFLSLPAGVALRILVDCLDEDTFAELRKVEKPTRPKPPKYDHMIFRQGGVQWASETDLEGLVFWRDRAKTSAESGSQWAARDAKNVESFNRWIAYREFYPDATWSGERNNEPLVASPPSSKPRVYPRTGAATRVAPPKQPDVPVDDYFGTGEPSASGNAYSEADYGGEQEIPF